MMGTVLGCQPEDTGVDTTRWGLSCAAPDLGQQRSDGMEIRHRLASLG